MAYVWHTNKEKPRKDAKVEVEYIDRGVVVSGIGYYMACCFEYVFNICGYVVETENIIKWKYTK